MILSGTAAGLAKLTYIYIYWREYWRIRRNWPSKFEPLHAALQLFIICTVLASSLAERKLNIA